MKSSVLILASFFLAATASAQPGAPPTAAPKAGAVATKARTLALTACASPDGAIGIEHLVPGPDNHKSLFDGHVTVFRYNRKEPVSVPEGIAIAYTTASDTEVRECRIVGTLRGGYFKVDLAKATITMGKGSAKISVPVIEYSPDLNHTSKAIEITVKRTPKRNPAREGFVVTAATP
ncbi:MAG: hypothetical protein KA297_27150 [Kofleriaceae bacterium]|nr:hypothetical protein [Kofleriaceae bacterium]MBP6838711.1 hypothetical protein [Kofleriaceae bacterium]